MYFTIRCGIFSRIAAEDLETVPRHYYGKQDHLTKEEINKKLNQRLRVVPRPRLPA